MRECIDEDEIMASKQNIKAIEEWNRENTDLIRIRVRKKEHLSERIQMAIDKGCGKSRQAYILDAVRRALEADGIPEIKEEEAAAQEE